MLLSAHLGIQYYSALSLAYAVLAGAGIASIIASMGIGLFASQALLHVFTRYLFSRGAHYAALW